MSPATRSAWRIALGLIALGVAPMAILMVVSLFTRNVGLWVYVAMAMLVLALIGAAMAVGLALWSLIVWLRD